MTKNNTLGVPWTVCMDFCIRVMSLNLVFIIFGKYHFHTVYPRMHDTY